MHDTLAKLMTNLVLIASLGLTGSLFLLSVYEAWSVRTGHQPITNYVRNNEDAHPHLVAVLCAILCLIIGHFLWH